MPLDGFEQDYIQTPALPDDAEWRWDLLEAARVMRERGVWEPCWFGPDNSVCLVGALMVAQGYCTGYSTWREEHVNASFYSPAGRRLASHLGCAPWDWLTGRTTEEAASVLEAAAREPGR